MVEIGSGPILESNVEMVRAAGITDVVINLHHRPEAVTDHFGDGSWHGVRIHWSYEHRLRGTGGALDQAREILTGHRIVVVYADNIFLGPLGPLLSVHRQRRPVATIGRLWRDRAERSGELIFDRDGRVRHLREKQGPPREAWVNAGIIVAEPRLLDYVPRGSDSDLAGDVLPAMLAAGERLITEPFPGEVCWIDTPADLARVRRRFTPTGGPER